MGNFYIFYPGSKGVGVYNSNKRVNPKPKILDKNAQLSGFLCIISNHGFLSLNCKHNVEQV